MKKITTLCILITIFFTVFSCNTSGSQGTESPELEFLAETGSVTPALRSAPFSKGVNFSGWFETYSAQGIPFTMYTEEDFINVKSLGADVIRLPVRMHSMTGGAPDYIFDPLLFKFLDSAVNWAEKHQLYLIIDNHSFDPVVATSNDIDKILIPVWTQIARRYRDRSSFIIYEILNEPHGISDARWGEIQGMAIQAIRNIDKDRLIIVGGTDYNSIGKLSTIPRYNDPNLIYTFHFYDPYLFTHQGATWGGPPLLTPLAGVPFPAGVRRMPSVPSGLRGTWIESSLQNNYSREARLSTLSATLDRVVRFSLERDVPIFCGEFGVYMINSLQEDRVRWYSYVTSALDRRNISRTSWDYYGGFGIFNSERGDFKHDVNVGVVKAMGFTPPPQTPRSNEPVNQGFIIFDDYPNNKMLYTGYWGDDVDFSLYDTNTANGEFVIRWGNASQYNLIHFTFLRTGIDLSSLVNEGFFLEFKARTGSPVSFDVRFVNSSTQPSIPWRMRYTIDNNNLTPNGLWQTIRIPLSQMSEHGAWVNETQRWLTPKGEFSWENVAVLEIVSEHTDLKGKTIWFDDIRITK